MKNNILRVVSLMVYVATTLSSYAQIGSSTNHVVKTTVEEEKYEISYSRIYHHFYAGYGFGTAKMTGNYEEIPMDIPDITGPSSVEFGWTVGFPLLKNNELYLETGLHFCPKFLKGSHEIIGYSYPNYFDLMIQGPSLEIPLNLTYLFHVGKKVNIAPYAGLELDFLFPKERHTVYEDNSLELYSSKLEVLGGFQLGLNIDIKKVHIGLAYVSILSNMMPNNIESGDYFYDRYSNMNLKYSDFRLRVGYTLHHKIKRRIQ